MEIVFYKTKLVIVIWTKSPTAFFMDNKDAVKSFRSYFDTFWMDATK